MRRRADIFIKGMIVGGTMLVPGVSGGSMAMILGIYDRLIRAVSSLGVRPVRNLLFLGNFAAGGLVGMILFARPLLYLVEHFQRPASYFFIGAVLGGVPMIGQKANVKHFGWKEAAWIFLGAGLVLLLAVAEQKGFLLGMEHLTTGYLLLAGCIGAVALVLPGISVSYLFLMLGLYDIIIKAIRDIQFLILVPLGLGLLLGIALTTKLLESAMQKRPDITYLVILGFVMGAVGTVFPGIPKGIEWLCCPALLAAGYIGVRWITIKEEN